MEGLIEREADIAVNQRPSNRFFAPKTGIAALVLSCVVLFSLYVRVADYGFYEDDYWGIVPWLKAPISDLWASTIDLLQTWPTGRPLNHILPPWFSWIGYHIDGFQGIYLLGFLVHSVNAFLIYLLLRKWLDHWSAILGGCFLVLLPPDTTRILLLHNAHIHTSLTFLLLGLLIQETRFRILSYPIAGLSLLSYETAFLPFIVFPLFFVGRNKRIRQWVIHLAGCAAVLAIVFGIRLHLGDARANSVISGPGGMVWRMVSSMWIGPETSLHTLVKAVVEAPHSQSSFAFVFAGLVVIMLLTLPRLIRKDESGIADFPSQAEIVKVLLAGLASWIFAYALTLTNYPPTQLAGRLTSTHIAAVFGLACAMAAGVSYFRSLSPTLKIVTTATASLLIGLFVLYSFRIQSGYATSWSQERVFWRQVVRLCPDIDPATRIILLGKEPSQNQFILANSWADLHVLEDAFAGDDHPLLFYYGGMAKLADIRYEDGVVTWKPLFWGDEREALNLDDVIILSENGNDITRISECQIPELPFPLYSKPLSSAQAQRSWLPLTTFGRFLLSE
jgi:hypothetical protein